ncbi:MAG: hypothetical protein LUG98_14345 [Tannerellaceae bacterium]|nr:hypothetical protein [Tannerellaceae bacterium]
MSRREELEKEVDILEKRIADAPKDTPKYVMDAWRQAYDDLSFDLNNLYDDEGADLFVSDEEGPESVD